MRRTILLALSLSLSLFACSHDLDRAPQEIQRLLDEARTSLEGSDLAAARTSYGSISTFRPEHAEAAAGWSLTDFLLMLDSGPAREFFDHCNQPHFVIDTALFGPDGLLAKEDRAELGTATLSTTYRPTPDAGDISLPWNAPTVLTEIVTQSRGSVTSDYLRITVRDRSSPDPLEQRALQLELNYPDLLGDGSQMRLVPGIAFDLGPQIDGNLSIFQPQDGASLPSEVPETGRIRFDAVNDGDGDRVAVEIIDAILPGWCLRDPCTSQYRVSGRIEDEVSKISIPEDEYPFGTVRADEGPPFAQELIVALERCNPIDDDFLAVVLVRGLGDVLAVQASSFHTAAAGDLSYSLPKELLHIDRDLPFNEADAAAFEAVTSATAAALDLVSRYRYFEGELGALVKTFTRNGSSVRDFDPMETVENLRKNLLAPRADFTLDIVRDRLRQSLNAIHDALTLEPQTEGIFDFRALPIRHLAEEYASFAEDCARSIDSEQPIIPEAAPTWQVHLKRLFDDPLTQENLADRLGVELFSTGTSSDAVELTPELANDWPSLFGGALVIPEGDDPPHLFSQAAFDSLVDGANGDWPYFVSTLIRDSLELSF